MYPALGIILLLVFATGFIVGASLGYGWGYDDAEKHRRRLHQQNKEKTT